MGYTFKRNIYYDIQDKLTETPVVFLLGPRKCGKTICLHQLNDNTDRSRYIDFKPLSENESMGIFDSIKESIYHNEEIVYLLDEITYAFKPEPSIYQIAEWLTETGNKNTKIVLTGSQSVALSAWANRAFAGNAGKIHADFLTYPEFLEYKNIKDITAESYNCFLDEVSDFYGFVSLKDYLQGCLEETIISNAKTSNYIFNNEVFLLENNIDTLINICYLTLFALHNQVNNQTFFRDNKLYENTIFAFREVCKQLGNKTIAEKIEQSFVGSYSALKSKPLDIIRQAFKFLYKCELISITPVSSDIENVPDISNLMSEETTIKYKEELFRDYNICIKYPMFYIRILKDILGDDMPKSLPGSLLGSVVECHARGLLPEGFTFRKIGGEEDGEVDYVNLKTNTAVEFTISNKSNKDINFKYLPNHLSCILLTKDQENSNEKIKKIPYYQYLYNLSDIPVTLKTTNHEIDEKYKLKGEIDRSKHRENNICDTDKLKEAQKTASEEKNKNISSNKTSPLDGSDVK